MRVFAVLTLPQLAIDRLMTLRLRLSSAQDGLRWSTPAQWHITLHFFGDLDESQAQQLPARLQGISASAPDIWIDSLGLFAAKGILFAAVQPTPSLVRLQTALAQMPAADVSPASSSVFHPHITLARSKGRAGQRHLAQLASPSLPSLGAPLQWRATQFVLLQSHLGLGGAAYEILEQVPLPAVPEPGRNSLATTSEA